MKWPNPIFNRIMFFRKIKIKIKIFQSTQTSPSVPFTTSGKYVCYGCLLVTADPSLQFILQNNCHPSQSLFVPSLVTRQLSQSLSQSSYDNTDQIDMAFWQAHELETASLVQDKLLQTMLCSELLFSAIYSITSLTEHGLESQYLSLPACPPSSLMPWSARLHGEIEKWAALKFAGEAKQTLTGVLNWAINAPDIPDVDIFQTWA